MQIKKLLISLPIIFFLIDSFDIYANENNSAKDNLFFKQFQDVFEYINKDYVQDPDKQKMTDAAINGMLTSLDPHSSYFTDEDLTDFLTQTEGEFGGIGVEVMYDNNAVKVVSPIDDLPADKAGIKTGDYIVGVDDDLVSNIGFNKAVKAMRGEPGTKVKLLVISSTETKPKELELVREVVKLKPVKSRLEGGNIAYIRIVTFNKQTRFELEKSFKTLITDSGPEGIKGIILDLRRNPGGLLEQAISVSEYFIDSGVIVSTKGRNKLNDSVFTSSKFSTKAPSVPMVVIIDGGSASASEIVAGALQDHKRALIIGTKSFGKGSVQTFARVSDRAAVKLTIARYYTPNGRSIQAEGIEPDIVIEPAKVQYSEEKDEDKRFSEASLKNYLKNDDSKHQSEKKEQINKDIEKNEKDEKPKETKQKETVSEFYKKDYQFARAYDLIRALILTKKAESK